MEFVAHEYPLAVPQIICFKAKLQPFSQFMFHNDVVGSVSPLAWWMAQAKQLNPDMLNLIKMLFTTVASSAGVERIFSTFGFIHSDVRNRLGSEKAAKLAFIYKMLNSSSK
jgi:hypothetical protein